MVHQTYKSVRTITKQVADWQNDDYCVDELFRSFIKNKIPDILLSAFVQSIRHFID